MSDMQIDKTKVYMDFQGFDQLRLAARKNDDEALKTVAKKFESIFLQMVMKSMRDANAVFKKDNFLQSDAVDFYQDMFDKQLTTNLTQGKGLGLSDVLVRQLSRGKEMHNDMSHDNKTKNTELHMLTTKKSNQSQETQAVKKAPLLFDTPIEFVKSLWHDAVDIAKKINLDPKMLIAQAALETGWGKSIIHANNGESSHNLFNIKADSSWGKSKINVNTLEYENGVAVKRSAPFRQYTSFTESFSDYVSFLQGFSRYSEALAKSDDPKEYINALQQAGYATDPDYADKVYAIYKSDTLNNALKNLEVK